MYNFHYLTRSVENEKRKKKNIVLSLILRRPQRPISRNQENRQDTIEKTIRNIDKSQDIAKLILILLSRIKYV
jgi:hypothetical protein